MIGGLIAGFVVSIIIFIGGHFAMDFDYELSIGGKILLWLVIFLVVMGLCIGIGIWADTAYYNRLAGTWEMTRANYEQAMSAYSDYESIIKDNPELIKEAMHENSKLADAKYDATLWWCWYIDDGIQNLEPIIIGGTN